MKNSQFLLGLLLFIGGPAFAQVADEGLPSPYFIDEVHCSGLNVHDVRANWLLAEEEVAPARKIEDAEMCERMLRVFGIAKYEWLSPDDLERTATNIRQSGYFKESDLTVKKSELKNHVHVFLTAKPVERGKKLFGRI